MKIPVPTERQEQFALVKWASYQPKIHDLLLHIANECDGGPIKGRIRKLLGVRKGVSDFFLPFPNKGYHGLWIELKRVKGGVLSPSQEEWLFKMRRLGFDTAVSYGWEQAAKKITEYLE